ncbi:MAG: KH domain-containing protein [Cyanobacteria bacterium P01_H01_bin.130]
MTSSPTSPDYPALLRFFLEPLLESPDALVVDCEQVASRGRVWIRIALAPTDRGRAYGREGHTLQAMQKIVAHVGRLAGQQVSLELFGERSPGRERRDGPRSERSERPSRRDPGSRPAPPRRRRPDES